MSTKPVATLGLHHLVAAGVGFMVAQVTLVSTLQGAGLGGLGIVVALTVALALTLLNAQTFCELALMFPKAGSVGVYTDRALGPGPAILVVLSGYVIVAILGLAAELLIYDQLLREVLSSTFPPKLLGVATVLVLLVVNLRGADLSMGMQFVLTLVVAGFMLLIGALALGQPGVSTAERAAFVPVLDPAFTGLVMIAIWALLGSEFMTPMIEETRDPSRNVPRAMFISLLVVFGVNALYVAGAQHVMAAKTLAESPAPHVAYASAVLGGGGPWIVAVLGVAATVTTVNTVIASVGRMVMGMAERGEAPSLLARRSARWGTPVAGVTFVGLAIAAFLLAIPYDASSVLVLIVSASSLWLLAIVILHVDLIVLRVRQPGMARPFRSWLAPGLPLLACAALVWVIFNNSPSPEMRGQVAMTAGGLLAAELLFAACWVRFVMKKSFFRLVPRGESAHAK